MQTKFTEVTKNDDKLKNKKKKKTFECDLCDFVSCSEAGLRSHQTRIHTISTINNQFPKTCDLCDYEVKNKTELKRQLKVHSYKAINFKCKECEFFCNTELEMQVHIGKKHTDNFDCGICESEMKSMLKLRIHQTTCERYKCEHCDKKFASLSDIKAHIKSEGLISPCLEIFHLKQNRTDSEVLDETSHFLKDLFPDLVKK